MRLSTSARTNSAPDLGASNLISCSCVQSVCLSEAARAAVWRPHARLTLLLSDSQCNVSRLALDSAEDNLAELQRHAQQFAQQQLALLKVLQVA